MHRPAVMVQFYQSPSVMCESNISRPCCAFACLPGTYKNHKAQIVLLQVYKAPAVCCSTHVPSTCWVFQKAPAFFHKFTKLLMWLSKIAQHMLCFLVHTVTQHLLCLSKFTMHLQGFTMQVDHAPAVLVQVDQALAVFPSPCCTVSKIAI